MFVRLRQCAPHLILGPNGVHTPNGISIGSAVFGGPFVKRFALCYQTVVCLSCFSVCPVCDLVHCGQTVGRIKMKLGTQVGLGPSHNVLDGDPAPPPPKWGRAPPQFSAHFYCGQTAGCIMMPLGMEVGLNPRDFVLNEDQAPSPKGEGAGAAAPYQSPQFMAHVLRPNGCMDQDATWYGGTPRPRQHCVRWGPSSPSIIDMGWKMGGGCWAPF